jgi:hypothetical protein
VFDVRCGSKRKWRHARMRSAFTSAMDTENAQRRLWNIVSCESAFLPKADVKYNARTSVMCQKATSQFKLTKEAAS